MSFLLLVDAVVRTVPAMCLLAWFSTHNNTCRSNQSISKSCADEEQTNPSQAAIERGLKHLNKVSLQDFRTPPMSSYTKFDGSLLNNK